MQHEDESILAGAGPRPIVVRCVRADVASSSRLPSFSRGARLLAAATAISAVAAAVWHSVAVFAIGSTGNVNLLPHVGERAVQWAGWTLVPGGLGATAISSGSVLASPSSLLRPYVVLINRGENIYYNAINSTGTFGGWTPVGINVGAVSISTGVIPTQRPLRRDDQWKR